tara:strand:+ start:1227 stop:1790 length:564 start_codon:yes stop_codon:yes gene_type:complete
MKPYGLRYTRGSVKAIHRSLGLELLVTGGQSGVDRAALDVAIALDIPCGGWCPRGRLAEDGPIDKRYPLQETPLARVIQRTHWNMRDSDGTLILARHRPRGGSIALPSGIGVYRPRLVVNPESFRARHQAIRFIRTHKISTLNMGGPRESEDPGIYAVTRAFLLRLFSPFLVAAYRHLQNQWGADSR